MTSLIVYTLCGAAIVAGVVCVVYGLHGLYQRSGRARRAGSLTPGGLLGPLEESESPFDFEESSNSPASHENDSPFMPEWFDPAYIESHLATIRNSPEQMALYFKDLENRFESAHERKVIEKLKEYHELILSDSAWDTAIQQAKQELEDAKKAWRAAADDDLQQLLKWDTGS